MKTVGLSKFDHEIIYIDPDYTIITNPSNGQPLIVKRCSGEPDMTHVKGILQRTNMKLFGSDECTALGTWCHELMEKK